MGKLIYSKFFIIILVVIFFISLIALGRESYRHFRINQRVENLEGRIVELERDEEEFIKMEEYFQSEEFLEKEARLKLNLIKPGEKLIIIKMPEELEEDKENEEVIAEEVLNVQRWWEYFFGQKL